MKVKAAIDYFGSVKAVADRLGISTQAVYFWQKDGNDVVPLRSAAALARESGGDLELGLDDYPTFGRG